MFTESPSPYLYLQYNTIRKFNIGSKSAIIQLTLQQRANSTKNYSQTWNIQFKTAIAQRCSKGLQTTMRLKAFVVTKRHRAYNPETMLRRRLSISARYGPLTKRIFKSMLPVGQRCQITTWENLFLPSKLRKGLGAIYAPVFRGRLVFRGDMWAG